MYQYVSVITRSEQWLVDSDVSSVCFLTDLWLDSHGMVLIRVFLILRRPGWVNINELLMLVNMYFRAWLFLQHRNLLRNLVAIYRIDCARLSLTKSMNTLAYLILISYQMIWLEYNQRSSLSQGMSDLDHSRSSDKYVWPVCLRIGSIGLVDVHGLLKSLL